MGEQDGEPSSGVTEHLNALLHPPTTGPARQGRRHVAQFVVTYNETERGGYTIEQKRGVDRSRWYTLAPAARSQLAQRLACLLDSIRL
jgi:hypothetical protein